jgi:hypothetical protein
MYITGGRVDFFELACAKTLRCLSPDRLRRDEFRRVGLKSL